MLNVAPVIAAAVGAARRRVVNKLRDRGATRPETAQPLEDLRRLERRMLTRLLDSGAVREVAPGRYYLDEPAWEASQSFRRRLALIIALVLLVVFSALYILAN